MKKGPCFTGCIALLLAALFSLAGCGSAGDGSSPPGNTDTAVTLNGVSANGSSTETTTRLTLTFSQAISGLGADDITLSGVAGVVKGTFSGSGPTYTLGVSGFGASGILSVSVAKTGYAVSGSPKTAAIYFKGSSGTTVSFNALTANGSSTETTTQLTLTFSQAIPGLSAADIILSGVAGIVKGTLSGAGPTYTLDVSGFTSGGTLSVSAIKAGYLISPSPKTVAVYYYSGGSGPGIVGYIGADGSSTQTTTRLWIFFDDGNGGEVAEIAGFSVDDITLSGVPGIRKDELIQYFDDESAYILKISGFSSDGNLSVNITKPGYTITVSSETLSGPIYYVNTSGASVVGKWIIDEASGSTAVELKSGYQWSYFAGENSPYNRSGTYQVFNDVATLMDSNGATVATARLLHKNVLYLDGINRYEYLSEYFRINDDTQTFIRQGTPSLTGKWTGSIGGTVVTVTINADTSWSLTSATGIYQLEGTGSRSGNTGSLAIPPPNGQGESTEDINLNLESENSMSVSVHRSSTLPLGTFTLTRTGS